jgi:hypothetical protein
MLEFPFSRLDSFATLGFARGIPLRFFHDGLIPGSAAGGLPGLAHPSVVLADS